MIRASVVLLATAWAFTAVADPANPDLQPMDHAGHPHEMATDDIAVLRERIPLYRDMTDEQINENMGRMPGDYAYAASAAAVRGDIGVLVLSHGAGQRGDQVLKDGVKPLAGAYPTQIGFGMAMMGSGHIQKALNELTAAGAKTVVVVPATVTEHASLHRQWDYIFGLRQDAAYLDVPKVKTEARIVMAPPMGDHPLMSKLLLDHAKELSTDPAKEVVILVGHGPTRAEDNAAEMAIMNTHARRLAAAGKFSSVKAVNLQDDAPAPVREANVKLLRGWVADAANSGRTPIIVGFLMSTRGIQGKIVEDLEGLPFKFQSKGITAHPNFTEWLRAIVAEQVKEL